jgi:hypothetical protein
MNHRAKSAHQSIISVTDPAAEAKTDPPPRVNKAIISVTDPAAEAKTDPPPRTSP